MRKASMPMRAVAAFLAFALVHISFGSQAWAQVVPVGAIRAPVGGSAAASVNRFPSPTNAIVPAMSLPNAGLTGSQGTLAIAPTPLTPIVNALLPVHSFETSVISLEATAAAKIDVAAAPDKAAGVAESAPLAIEVGPITSGAASKASRIAAGVLSWFGAKSAEVVPTAQSAVSVPVGAAPLSDSQTSGLNPSESKPVVMPLAGVNNPPAPSQPDKPAAKGKGWFGLGAIVAALIGGMLVMQLGLEAQGAAMSQLTEDSFGDFSILAQVAVFFSIGTMIGQQLAQFFSARFGLTRTFYAAHVLRAVSLGAMVFLLGTGMMPLPLMFVFYALNGVATGVAATAESTLRKFLLAQQGISQQKYRTWWQLLAEIVAVPAPMVLGALVLSVGAGWITALYPALILVGLMIFLMLKVIPWSAANRIENQVAAAAKQASPSPVPDAPKAGAWQKLKAAFAQIFANMQEGKDFVFKNAALKYSLFGAVIFDLMNALIYRLIAPGYGKLVAGSAGMAEVQGNLVGMFSLGGLVLAVVFLVLERRAKTKDAGKSPAELAAAERSSMLRWTLLSIPALGLLGVMAFSFALPFAPVMFMGVNWVPSTVLAAMLIPFGFMQVAASIKLNSYFQERLPSDAGKVQKALAFSGSVLTALTIVLLLTLKPLFGDIASFNPFPYIAAALVPLGAAALFIQRRLASATKPENFKIVGDVPGEKTSGGFGGALVGVVAAALLLTFMTLIPGVSGLVAGLGVLGKFLLHLGVTLALPVAGWFADRAIRKRSK